MSVLNRSKTITPATGDAQVSGPLAQHKGYADALARLEELQALAQEAHAEAQAATRKVRQTLDRAALLGNGAPSTSPAVVSARATAEDAQERAEQFDAAVEEQRTRVMALRTEAEAQIGAAARAAYGAAVRETARALVALRASETRQMQIMDELQETLRIARPGELVSGTLYVDPCLFTPGGTHPLALWPAVDAFLERARKASYLSGKEGV